MKHNLELTDKVCLITGASRTLGADIARALGDAGARLAINYHRSVEAAQNLKNELTAAGVDSLLVQADVSQPEQIDRLVRETYDHFGQVDVLVNNVGPYVDTPFLALPLTDFDRILAGNVRTTFMLTQAVGQRMKAAGQGKIINIAATDAFHRSHSIYGLAKQGVIYLTEALALELAPEVCINALAPDLIADNESMSAALVERSLAGTPLGRLVTRAEVAHMVCLLCTPAFATVTGQTIVLDGGRSIPRLAVSNPKTTHGE
jgi:NAD(P)-dependent dehydrogenase (short-subunit alcohol dehydrogenase family)